MKKTISLLLVLTLCFGLAACGGTGNETHDYILRLLESGEYDMAIYVIEGLRDGKVGTPEQEVQQNVPDSQWDPDSLDQFFELTPETIGTDWIFHMDLINYTDRTLTLESLLIHDWLEEEDRGTAVFEGTDLEYLGIDQLVLESGQGRSWDDAHPVVTDLGRREYLFVFHDENGETIQFSYTFDMHDMLSEGIADSGDPSMEQPTGDWVFPMVLENTGDTPWELQCMDITHFMNEESLGTTFFEGANLDNIGLGGLVLQPGQYESYIDGHPVVSDWNAAEYRFFFVDGNGQQQTLTFRFDDLDKQNQTADYSQDQDKDLKTLRHDASYEVEVADGVYWVPAVSLGTSHFSNMDIHKMLSSTPEEKQQNISTLYEALQLYQVGNFTSSDDNIRISENGVNWEHHKPGYHAVRTNTGCCATDSNWLHYILDGDYEEVGFFATSQRDGSGHVYNYILHDGWYYFVDLTHYHASGSPIDNAVEDGDLNSYYSTDYILGNIHKARSVQDYVDYVQQTFNDPPGLMLMYTAEDVLAVDGPQSQSGVQIIYEEANGQQINVVFDDPGDSLTFIRKASPKNLPDWSQLPDAIFP